MAPGGGYLIIALRANVIAYSLEITTKHLDALKEPFCLFLIPSGVSPCLFVGFAINSARI
jgi:hypothetical protein